MLGPGAERRSGCRFWCHHGFSWIVKGWGFDLVKGKSSGGLAGGVGGEDGGGGDVGALMGVRGQGRDWGHWRFPIALEFRYAHMVLGRTTKFVPVLLN